MTIQVGTDTAKTRRELTVGDQTLAYYSIPAAEEAGLGSFANLPAHEPANPAPAPYLGQHSEEVLAERLGLSSGAIGALVDAGTVALSDATTIRDNR